MMSQPAAPFLELALYVDRRPEAANLRCLVDARIETGASIGSSALTFAHPSGERPYFAIAADLEPTSIAPTEDMAAFRRLADRTDLAVLRVELRGGADAGRAPEIATFGLHFAPGVHRDLRPVVLWQEGRAFTGLSTHHAERRRGLQAYELFRRLVVRVRPAYAAITVEIGMECPTDLRADPRTRSFGDCFLSGAAIGDTALTRVRALASELGGYAEPVADGYYFSTHSPFNPPPASASSRRAARRSRWRLELSSPPRSCRRGERGRRGDRQGRDRPLGRRRPDRDTDQARRHEAQRQTGRISQRARSSPWPFQVGGSSPKGR